MPRPEVSIETERRLRDLAFDVSDDLPVSPSHEQALEVVLDRLEELEEDNEDSGVSVETMEDLLNQQQEQSDPFGGTSGSVGADRRNSGGWRTR